MGRPFGSKNRSNMDKMRVLQDEVNRDVFGHTIDETNDDIDSRIQKTFRVLEKVVYGIINGNVCSAIVSGAAGCGKTFTVEKLLHQASTSDSIRYTEIKGSMSAVKLYQTLYENNAPNSVLVIDDCDAVFFDEEALDVLKSALDSTARRVVHWNKQNNIFMRDGIPDNFEYEGSVIFITNIDIGEEMEKGTKISPHIKALVSRSIYVDLGIYTKREILVRVTQVLNHTPFLQTNELTNSQGEEMVTWLHTHLSKLRLLSIRTLLHLGSIIKTDPEWQDMAEVILCRRR